MRGNRRSRGLAIGVTLAASSVACVPTPDVVEPLDAGQDASFDAGFEAGVAVWSYSVYAGNGATGFSGDEGPATHAELGGYLSGIAKDAAGNLFIADSGNSRIRKVDPSGVITTYAGNGTAGYSGDTGPAVDAELNGPTGVTVDTAGNVYFSEFNNDSIRAIDPAGTITTYVDLPGAPTGLTIDAAGRLYVAMYALQEVLRIDADKVVTIVAGTGVAGHAGDNGPAVAATLDNPTGVWADADGSLYVIDSNNHVLRRVDPTGTITTFAGTGTAGYSGDEGPATSAELSSANGVVGDGRGNLYFTQGANNVVRQIDAAGTIHTIAGTGAMRYSNNPGRALATSLDAPAFLWLDTQGALYFSQFAPSVAKLTP